MITRQMWMMGGAGLVSVAVVAGLVATIRPAPAPVETAPAPAAAAPAPQPVTAPPPIRPGGIDGLNLNEAPAKPAPTPSVVTLGDPNAPKFDVVRVEPSGDAVVAGTGRPGAVVRLRADGVIIAESKIEAGGQFVLLPKALAPGGHLLSLETALGGGAPLASAQSVSVNVPKDGKGEVIVALTEPDKATVLLSDAVKSALAKPPAPSRVIVPNAPASALPATGAPAANAGPRIAIRTVEVEDSGAFFATGLAPPGAFVRLYLNDAFVASVTAAPDGRWSLKIERGMQPGQYAVRTDEVNPASGAVVARAEVAFVYPRRAAPAPVSIPAPDPRTAAAQTGVNVPARGPQTPAPPAAAAAKPPQRRPAGAAAAPARTADAVVETLATAKVASGDSLWRISRHVYGRGFRYTQIYNANTRQIRNPRMIFPGQILVVPKTGPNRGGSLPLPVSAQGKGRGEGLAARPQIRRRPSQSDAFHCHCGFPISPSR